MRFLVWGAAPFPPSCCRFTATGYDTAGEAASTLLWQPSRRFRIVDRRMSARAHRTLMRQNTAERFRRLEANIRAELRMRCDVANDGPVTDGAPSRSANALSNVLMLLEHIS